MKHSNGSTKKCHYNIEMVVLWKLNKLSARQKWIAMLENQLLGEKLNLK